MNYNWVMRYEEIIQQTNDDFKRLTGVRHDTFKQMLKLPQEQPSFDRRPKLCLADLRIWELKLSIHPKMVTMAR